MIRAFPLLAVRVLVFLALFYASGCATPNSNHEQTESMLGLANFTLVPTSSATVADKIAQIPPFEMTALPNGRKEMNFYFYNPQKQSVWVGDLNDYERLGAIQQKVAFERGQQALQHNQANQMQAEQNRARSAQLGQALALGLVAGAAQLGQNMQQQSAARQQALAMQEAARYNSSMNAPFPMPTIGRNSSPQTTTFTPDGFGGFRGSDGSSVQPDGFGGYRVQNGL